MFPPFQNVTGVGALGQALTSQNWYSKFFHTCEWTVGEIPRELSLLSEFSVSNPRFYVYYVIPFLLFG